MSSESQSHSRKRRDRKKIKKGECETEKLDVILKGHPDTNDDDSSGKEDNDEPGKEEEDDSHHHHHASGGILSTLVFLLLFGGLVVLTSMIFLELKDSKEVGPSITESRYASFLGDLVDEHVHDHDEDEEHLTPHVDDHDEDEEEAKAGPEEDFSHYEHQKELGDETSEIQQDIQSGVYQSQDVSSEQKAPSLEEQLQLDNRDDVGQATDAENIYSYETVDPSVVNIAPSEGIEESNVRTESESEAPSVVDVDQPLQQEQHIEQNLPPMELDTAPETNESPNTESASNIVSDSETPVVEGNVVDEDIVVTLPLPPLPEEPRIMQPQPQQHVVESTQQEIQEPYKEEFVATEQKAEPPPDPWEHYEQADITNQYDYEFHQELDQADKELEKDPALF